MSEPLPSVLRRLEMMEETARLVVVAAVPVAFTKVKFWRVDEPVERRLAKVARDDELMTEAKRLVE